MMVGFDACWLDSEVDDCWSFVVECRGYVMTKENKPYNNTYCYVCRLENGQIKELTEYLDTELVSTVLGDPA